MLGRANCRWRPLVVFSSFLKFALMGVGARSFVEVAGAERYLFSGDGKLLFAVVGLLIEFMFILSYSFIVSSWTMSMGGL